MTKTITILEGNYNSTEEAKDFATYCESRGVDVDYRANTSGYHVEQDEEAEELAEKLWSDFCNA